MGRAANGYRPDGGRGLVVYQQLGGWEDVQIAGELASLEQATPEDVLVLIDRIELRASNVKRMPTTPCCWPNIISRATTRQGRCLISSA